MVQTLVCYILNIDGNAVPHELLIELKKVKDLQVFRVPSSDFATDHQLKGRRDVIGINLGTVCRQPYKL